MNYETIRVVLEQVKITPFLQGDKDKILMVTVTFIDQPIFI